MRDPLAHRAAATPDATALVRADDPPVATGGTDRHPARDVDPGPDADGIAGPASYGDLDAAVERTAGWLAARGVEPGDHVAALVETGPAAVRLVHAALRLGAPLVPLNGRLAEPELGDRVERSDAVLVVASPDAAGTARVAAGDVPVATLDADHLESTALEPADLEPTRTALIPFTSGTTGRPRAVRLSLANLVASAAASAFRLGVLPGDRWYVPLPTYHMGGLAPVLRSTLYGTAVVLERGGSFDAERTLARMAAHEPTGVSLVPTMLRRLLAAGELPDSLRFVLLGGAPAPDDLIRECERRGVPVCPTYGMTETASQIATARPGEAFANPGTVGRPLVGTTVTVVDEAGEALSPGETGELVVDGPTVTAGYYGDADATSRAFGEFGLHTGDVGYRDDAGRLWILNRRSDRIVTGGENVDPGEVAAALTAHPDVRAAAVVGLPDPEWGERVAALVVGDVDRDALAAHCRERLAGFKVPRVLAFADGLPRTASGTVDRAAVRERLRGDGEPL